MRIDDLNRALQPPEAAKTDIVGPDRSKAGESSAPDSNSDAASISALAARALHPASDAESIKANDARVEMLRLQVERGEYNVSARDVAASIIDQHIRD
jgi:anti-sigma28 factor (negative regulator of flagellin synthesis)